MNATAYRFTDRDEDLVRAGIRAAVDDRRARHEVVRAGAAALACTVADLRGVELDWIDEEIAGYSVEYCTSCGSRELAPVTRSSYGSCYYVDVECRSCGHVLVDTVGGV